MRAIFRVDSSSEIGSGHISRCLTLAKSLRERGFDCLFICRDHLGNFNSRVTDAGFHVELLPVDPKLEQDCPEKPYEKWIGSSVIADAESTISVLGEKNNELVVVDHYGLDYVWEDKLRPYTKKIVAIDDLANRRHNANYLLDQNLVSNHQTRYSGLLSKDCVPLLGPEFALLQPEYSRLRPSAAPRTGPVKRILISFGGSDPANITGLSVSAFLKLGRSDIELDVVLGNGSSHSKQIERCASAHPNVHIHHSLPTLAHLMLKADLAIGAAGSTAWERCCLGLPSIVITLADNQKPIAEELARRDLVHWIGQNYKVDERDMIDTLIPFLGGTSLEQWSKTCLDITDGLGAQRVVSALTLFQKTKVKSRVASYVDEPTLFNVVSSTPDADNNSSAGLITTDEHKAWFYSKLRDPESFRVFIYETDSDLLLGAVYFELLCREWQISYAFSVYVQDTYLKQRVIDDALQNFQSARNESFCFVSLQSCDHTARKEFGRRSPRDSRHKKKLSLAICSDKNSWVNSGIPELFLTWLGLGYACQWVHDAETLKGGDLCFYLSYGKIVTKQTLAKYQNNLVVHASDLPKGKGWSPTSWMILAGKEKIPVTLLEADEQVDSGDIYDQVWIDLDESDLVEDWRRRLLVATKGLVTDFVRRYPTQPAKSRKQVGEASFYTRRKARDSQLDPNQTIAEQFNLLRIVDNVHYPAFFELYGEEFVLEIKKRNRSTH